jgi:hypothetical protein
VLTLLTKSFFYSVAPDNQNFNFNFNPTFNLRKKRKEKIDLHFLLLVTCIYTTYTELDSHTDARRLAQTHTDAHTMPQYVSFINFNSVVENIVSTENIYFGSPSREYGSMLSNSNYNYNYELAYEKDKVLSRTSLYTSSENSDTQVLHLSRIAKKNGLHRYYLTFVDEHVECIECGSSRSQCSKRFCDGYMSSALHFSSTYIGTNLEEAIASFLLHKTRN